MYKAIHNETGEEIIILHPRWRERIDALRELDQADQLVCQGCRQPLRVKAGRLRRPHFAHKHLQACTYGRESPELLNARAVLYEWLHRQFGEQVTVEKPLDGADLPRPVDCWVDTPRGPFAYWIVEAGVKLDPRIAIKEAMARLEGKGHFVFLISMLNEEKKLFHSLLLSPTERAFLKTTPYDEAVAGLRGKGGSLHYLDPEQASLTTYRNLLMHHPPNWFAGRKKSAPLDEARASSLDGSILYPGEREKLNAVTEKRERLAQKRARYTAQQSSTSSPQGVEQPRRAQSPRRRGGWEPAIPPAEDAPEALQCTTCGKITRDYWSTFFDEQGQKRCRCRECLESGRFEP